MRLAVPTDTRRIAPRNQKCTNVVIVVLGVMALIGCFLAIRRIIESQRSEIAQMMTMLQKGAAK